MDNLGLGAVGSQGRQANGEAVAEGQQWRVLGGSPDELLDKLDSHLGNEGGGVGAVLDVLVQDILVGR